MTDRCCISRCLDESAVSYLGHGVCTRHWDELTNETAPPDALRKVLGIAAEPELENTHMASKKKTTQPTEQPAAETPQTAAAPPEKKAKPAKPPKVEKPAKPEKPARPPKEEGLVVFAFRLTEAERDAIHKAAGPARASRFVRTIAVAAANEDEAAIRAMIKEAGEARA
jgi:outer membrane biosynthesis protein TonB